MRTSKIILAFCLVFLLASCATTADFPVSEMVPAAEISLKVKEDKNKNYKISIKAKHLASPERLATPASYYVVWLDTYDGYKNVGQLRLKNAKKASLETLSPYEFQEILITAEQTGDAAYPQGEVIARSSFISKE